MQAIIEVKAKAHLYLLLNNTSKQQQME